MGVERVHDSFDDYLEYSAVNDEMSLKECGYTVKTIDHQ
jgi:hypothetical protein